MKLSLIKIIAEKKGIAIKHLATKIGMTEQGFHQMVARGSTKMDTLNKIAIALNVDVNVFLNENFVGEPLAEYHKIKKLPLLDTLVQAGGSKGFSDKLEDNIKYIIVPGFEDCNFAVKVQGQSMVGKYNAGDILLCKILQDKIHFTWGRSYAIATTDGLQIKTIQPSEDEKSIVLESENKKYKPMIINKKSITALAIIRGVIQDEGN